MPTARPPNMDCICSNCDASSQGKCIAKLGCFSLLEPDGKKGYIVKKGCIDSEMNLNVICENAVHPSICCKVNLCNWNITPPFPTELPSKLYSYCTAQAGFTWSWKDDEESWSLKFVVQAWKSHGNKKKILWVLEKSWKFTFFPKLFSADG